MFQSVIHFAHGALYYPEYVSGIYIGAGSNNIPSDATVHHAMFACQCLAWEHKQTLGADSMLGQCWIALARASMKLYIMAISPTP